MIPALENEVVDVYRKLYDGGMNPDQLLDIRERMYTLHHLILASGDSWPVKTCSCGRQYKVYEWLQLPLVGYQSASKLGGELRNCVCGSTLFLAPRREPFSMTRAPILQNTIVGNRLITETRPPFSLQECMNISDAYSRIQHHVYFDKWTQQQVIEAATYGAVPRFSF